MEFCHSEKVGTLNSLDEFSLNFLDIHCCTQDPVLWSMDDRHSRRDDLGEVNECDKCSSPWTGNEQEHGWTVGFALQTSKAVVCSILCIRNNIRSYLLNCSSTYLSTMLHIMTLQFTVAVTGNDLFVKNAEYYVSHIPFKHPSKHSIVRLPGP